MQIPHTHQDWGGRGETGILVHCCWERKMVQRLWKTVRQFFKKLEVKLPYDPATPLLGIHLKELKAESRRNICTPEFLAT